MIERLVTQSGSEYTIDYEKKTWERKRGTNATKMRTDSGSFIDIRFEKIVEEDESDSLVLHCPPINPPFPRLITSTPIVLREIIE